MDFNAFVNTVKESIKEYLPEEFKDASVEIVDSKKLNELYTALVVRKGEQPVAPTINMERLYAQYDSGRMDFDEVMHQAAEVIRMQPGEVSMERFTNYEKAKDQLFIRVSRIEGNEETLKDVPYTQIEDLAMTYHVMADIGVGGLSSTIVSHSMMENFDVSKEQLHQDALDNSPKLFPAVVEPMETVMRRIMGADLLGQGMPQEMVDDILSDMMAPSTGDPMIVVTNDQTINGASVLFYPEQMEQMGERIGGDFFVLPSSVHELLVVPDNGDLSYPELKAMVTEINETQVAPEERLTNEVYHYDAKDRVFERVPRYEERQKAKEKAMEQEGKKEPAKANTKDREIAKPSKKHHKSDMSL